MPDEEKHVPSFWEGLWEVKPDTWSVGHGAMKTFLPGRACSIWKKSEVLWVLGVLVSLFAFLYLLIPYQGKQEEGSWAVQTHPVPSNLGKG